ncbi:hypothetical protein BOX37_08335 [Nocardia mangyaensis]|uniref:Uncharacterized protein n=1 Tax=Nocardia mangyaensis TaxID=2213200 RepID=A0A1J0VPL9_9NOCA|nr:hypothetical protein [Nocardia mangyaensis]APE33979.1 hypothetical protein BOX37_08335 [Nocardia mangyaensis]
MRIRIAATSLATLAFALVGAGSANAVTTGFCEQHGGIAIGIQDGTWWCVGGFGDGQQILFPRT